MNHVVCLGLHHEKEWEGLAKVSRLNLKILNSSGSSGGLITRLTTIKGAIVSYKGSSTNAFMFTFESTTPFTFSFPLFFPLRLPNESYSLFSIFSSIHQNFMVDWVVIFCYIPFQSLVVVLQPNLNWLGQVVWPQRLLCAKRFQFKYASEEIWCLDSVAPINKK
jgi:hypothetical protein